MQCQNVAILKPHKGYGAVLLDNQDYINLVEQLFKGQIKFKILEKNPTITQMTTLQNYLQNLCNRGEISKAEFDQMRPKNLTPARAHGLPKVHKTFTNIWDSRYSIQLVCEWV